MDKYIDRLNKSKKPSYMSNMNQTKNTNKTYSQPFGTMFGEESNSSYRSGMLVEHPAFGKGVIISVEGSILRIAFQDVKYGVKLIASSFKGLKIIGG